MPLTLKDKREQFKRDCKSLTYYERRIHERDDRLRELDIRLTGLARSSDQGNPSCENGRDPYKDYKLIIICEQDKIREDYKEDFIMYDIIMKRVNEVLFTFEDAKDQSLIEELYIKKRNHDKIAERFGYASRQAMYKHINKIMDKIFKVDTK